MNTAQRLAIDLLTADLGTLRQAASTPLTATAEQARNMYDGYHLGRPIGGGEMDLSYWVGPQFEPDASGSEASQREVQRFLGEFQRAVRRSFTSTNYVRQVLKREMGSATSRMSWTVLDPNGTDGVSALRDTADTLVKAWWRLDQNKAERSTRQAILTARREARGILRFRVADAALVPDPARPGRYVIRTRDMAELSRYVQLDCIETPEHVGTWQNPSDLTRHAVYTYRDAAEQDAAEIASELPTGQTLLRVVRADGSSTPVTLDLQGRLTIIELDVEALITPQVLQNQMAYNAASTMILRNTELAGFIERYGINVEPPYVMRPDPDNPGQQVRDYLPVKVGAATMNLWRGATYDEVDPQGNYQGEKPLGKSEYGRFEPVSPEALVAAAEHSRTNIYSEVAQDYVQMSGVATASGRSREISISDFESTREPVVELARYAIGTVIETYLALVSALAGQPGLFKDLQVEGSVKARVVPPSSFDRAADLADVQAGVISLQTARNRQGIDSPEQEDAQIQAERDAGLSPTLQPTATPPPTGGPRAGA